MSDTNAHSRRGFERAILVAVWLGLALMLLADVIQPPSAFDVIGTVFLAVVAVQVTMSVRRWRREDTKLRPVTLRSPMLGAALALFVAAAVLAYALS